MMKKFLVAGAAVLCLSSGAQAQAEFSGIRVQAAAGLDHLMARSRSDNALMYNVGVGFDGRIGQALVGADFGYGDSKAKVCRNTTLSNSQVETGCTSANEEYTAGIRLGFMATPNIALYGRGGYAAAEHYKSYANATTNGFSDRRYNTDGYHLGAGAELSVQRNLFFNAEYRYYNWNDNTSRHALLAGAGIRF